mgnify:CR=1 FL=1
MKWTSEKITNRRSNKERHQMVIRSIILLCSFGLPFLSVRAAESNAAKIENTRTALERWVETQRIISKEKRDLELAKEILNERIELMEREIESLRAKIDEAKKNIAETNKKRGELLAENDELKEASEALGDVLVSLEERTNQLLRRLPDPIRERLKPLSQRLPQKKGETKLSISERFQNVVGILNEVDKFNGEITVASEIRTLPDGASAEVTALYLGVGEGYYVGANEKIAGVGSATNEGWVWKPASEYAARIAQVIAILKNEQAASFVQLPIEIQ